MKMDMSPSPRSVTTKASLEDDDDRMQCDDEEEAPGTPEMPSFLPSLIIEALGYPADVVTNGHAGVLWVFDISEENQMSVMRALKTHEADIEEHWIDVGWWATLSVSCVFGCAWRVK